MRPLVGLLTFVVLAPPVAAQDNKPPAVGQRVFTAGHSFHMPMVQPLGQIAKAAGVDGHTPAGTQGIGGSTVTQHWDRPDSTNAAKKAIKAGTVDVLTLSPHFVLPDEAIDKFTALLLEANPKGRVTVQASWLPHVAAIEKVSGYSDADRDKTDLAALRKAGDGWAEKLRAQVKAINDKHAEKLKRPVVFVVPTGDALTRLRERVAKGTVPGVAKQADLFSDDFGHTKAPVAVMNAYCHYAVIYGRSPVGLPVPAALDKANLGENAAKVNRVLQECAWEAVTAEPLSGVTGKRD